MDNTPPTSTIDIYKAVQAPQRGITEIVNTKIDIQFIGVLISSCEGAVILSVLALAALRNLGIWTWLDPHWYAVIVCCASIVVWAAIIYYIVGFVRSGKSRGV